MINTNTKISAFIISLIGSLLSWILILISSVFKIADLYQYGLTNISLFGFAMTTIIMSVYTFFILFKISGTTYFPIVLMFFHLVTLTESAWLFVFLAIDIALIILLNVRQPAKAGPNYYNYHRKHDGYYNNANNESSKPNRVDSDNVFDAEYTTKDEDNKE